MGMYTTIIDDEGREFQIKTGMDDMERFKVGDEVPWKVDKNHAGCGHLLDGIYLAEPHGHKVVMGLYYWVVIKDHKILGAYLAVDYPEIASRCPIPPHPREWWTEEAWERHSEETKQAARERLAFQAMYGHLPPVGQIAVLTGKFVKAKMECESLARRILPPVSLSQEMAEKIQNMPEPKDDLEWYCDSCDWVGDYNEVLFPNEPVLGGHPACPNCPSDHIHSRKKGTMCPECKGKGTVPNPPWDHKFFDPVLVQIEAKMGGARKECPNCKGRGTV